MEYYEFLYTYIEGSVEILLMVYFFFLFLQKRIRILEYIAFASLGIVITIFLPVKGIGEFFIFVLILIAEGVYVCKEKYLNVILYAIVTVEIMRLGYGMFNSLSCILCARLYARNPETISMLCMVIGSILALFVSVFLYLITYRFFINREEMEVNYELMILIPVLLLFFVSEYIKTAIYGNRIVIGEDGKILNVVHYKVLVVQLLGTASLFCVLFAYKKLADNFSLSIKYSLLEQEANLLQQYVGEAKARYEKTKSFRHDVKNHIEIVKRLLENGQNEQVLAYICDMKNISEDMSFPCDTGHPVLNILLMNKLGIAKSKDIDVFCSLCVPYPCQIRDMDFCIILSNALDNAITACEKLDSDMKKYIRTTGNRQGDFLMLCVQNSFQGGSFLKEGIGLKNIRTVSEKYNGVVNIETQGNEFSVSVLLVIPQQPECISQQMS